VPKRRCMLPMSVWAVAWLMEFPKMYPLMNYIITITVSFAMETYRTKWVMASVAM
jgi:hypothetical protein